MAWVTVVRLLQAGVRGNAPRNTMAATHTPNAALRAARASEDAASCAGGRSTPAQYANVTSPAVEARQGRYKAHKRECWDHGLPRNKAVSVRGM